jgi:hypothetical protein
MVFAGFDIEKKRRKLRKPIEFWEIGNDWEQVKSIQKQFFPHDLVN